MWYAVKRCAGHAGITNLAPHDLRRTCARLCHGCGGELEQIQFLLGHASVQTMERYIGSKQKLQDAANDRLGDFGRKRHGLNRSVVERFEILAIASFIVHYFGWQGRIFGVSLWELFGVKFCPLFGVTVQKIKANRFP